MAALLIVDDEKNIRRALSMILSGEGYACDDAEDGAGALRRLEERGFDLVFLDLLLPDLGGLDVLRRIRADFPDVVVVMMSGHGTIEHAVEAVKLGAYDFIEKPLTKEKVLITTRNALERHALVRQNQTLKDAVTRRFNMIGTSEALNRVREQILRVAPTNARVLILGESGTGKELAARAIHDNSPRKDKPFVKVNCAAIPEELIESELFGAVKGAYTGATADREGKFAQADGGTIFLDEIGDMSLKVQSKVLRVLQEGELERVGSSKTVTVDVRVLAATNKDLKKETERGRFREDLFFRLNVVPIRMPSLRERRADIPMLVDHFVEEAVGDSALRRKSFSGEAMAVLTAQEWTGNIRELRNVVERVMILSADDVVQAKDLMFLTEGGQIRPVALSDSGRTLREIKEEVERAHILQTLQKNNWNVTRSAAELGVERTNLHKKLKYYGLSSDKMEEGAEND